ncbi:MAG: ATP-binding protein, partial [Selenomonadaceae bacterium]|nr:ATP-binding protein [Selenomonadaceae bacterium]
NPILADKIISLINGSDHEGQFVFTTHNVLHLNLENYMKEQIFFVTKNLENLKSEIYSLSEFDEVEYNSEVNLYEIYLRGVLGGTLSE